MRSLVLSLLIAVSACSMAPTTATPELPVPPVYPLASGADARGADALGWRTMFGDPRLQRLIEIALQSNLDLRQAALNVEAARAQYGIQRAAQMPAVDATAAATRQRTAGATQTSMRLQSGIETQYSLGAGINAFEIDLFGRVKSLSAAALNRYFASEEGRLSVQISLVGAVADAYFAERLADGQSQLARYTLTDWKQSLELTRRLKQADQSSAAEVAQAESQVARAEADLAARKRDFAKATNTLRFVLGADIPSDLPPALPLESQPVVKALPAGLPSDLLLRRPDLRQAEQNLKAANADIGAARAAFFPRLSIAGAAGFASPAIGNLFAGEQRIWTFAPQLTLPLFQGGRLRSELALAEVRKSSAVVDYERSIQSAFREVADGLAGRETFSRELEARRRAVSSAEHRVSLADLRYRAGIDGRLELLDAQRQLYLVRQELLDLQRGELANAVSLYKALGGGLAEYALNIAADSSNE